ncbi:BspA family leucine-rich repeat surface protein [Lactococcus allomyrinae]|uniref:BspA family leucine-rich repeat surface protein n=1 Tax=Lactococcus allomyrinae TaxID=2419773 RepID=A0A387BL13_9LACT|nr:BspA family leucine-rich repeat surface protein [Lactococcus allomyrinae]AYG01879.1 BspA family leucine-rich repeat surface protein [Lactococcus allomyrinae]
MSKHKKKLRKLGISTATAALLLSTLAPSASTFAEVLSGTPSVSTEQILEKDEKTEISDAVASPEIIDEGETNETVALEKQDELSLPEDEGAPLAPETAMTLESPTDITPLTSGTFYGVEYTYEDGVLTFEGGTFETGAQIHLLTIGSIKKIVFTDHVTAAVNSQGLFSSLYDLEEIERLDFLNTSYVTNMESMFAHTTHLSALDLSGFQTSNVTTMARMFYYSGISSLNLGEHFNTAKVTDMSSMFSNITSLATLNLGGHFNTANVEDMQYMFHNSGITSLDLGNHFNPIEVKNMEGMFSNLPITSLDLGNSFHTESVTDMRWMFSNTPSLTSLNLGSHFNTAEVTDMAYMFNGTGLISLNLGNHFNTAKVTDMSTMFHNTTSLTSLDLGEYFNTALVTNMDYMFYSTALTSLDLGKEFNTANVTTMMRMFANTTDLTSLNLGGHFNTAKVINMEGMFNNSAVTSLDLSSFDILSAADRTEMLADTASLQTLTLGQHTNLSGAGLDEITGTMWQHTDGTTQLSASLMANSAATDTVTGTWTRVSRFEASPENFALDLASTLPEVGQATLEHLRLLDLHTGTTVTTLDTSAIQTQLMDLLDTGETGQKLIKGKITDTDTGLTHEVSFTVFLTNGDTAIAVGDLFVSFNHFETNFTGRLGIGIENLLAAGNFMVTRISTLDDVVPKSDVINFNTEHVSALTDGDTIGEHLIGFTVTDPVAPSLLANRDDILENHDGILGVTVMDDRVSNENGNNDNGNIITGGVDVSVPKNLPSTGDSKTGLTALGLTLSSLTGLLLLKRKR